MQVLIYIEYFRFKHSRLSTSIIQYGRKTKKCEGCV